jgi:hypothetical protein
MKIDREIKVIECIYCNDIAGCRHHYKESVANSGRKRGYSKEDVLPTCKECNALLSSRNPEYPDCCLFLYNEIKSRHKKILNQPDWDEDDLEEMSAKFKKNILASIKEREIQKKRLENLMINYETYPTYEDLRNILDI